MNRFSVVKKIDYTEFLCRPHVKGCIERYKVFRDLDPSDIHYCSYEYAEFLFTYDIIRQELCEFICDKLSGYRFERFKRHAASQRATVMMLRFFGVNPDTLRRQHVRTHWKEHLPHE